MAFAGIWEGRRGVGGEVLRSFAIITTDANQLMAPIHNRMPVVVEEAIGRCGSARLTAIRLRSSGRRKRACCGLGR